MLIVRRATADDVEDVQSLGSEVWAATYTAIAGRDYVQHGVEKWWSHEAVLRSITSSFTYVAVFDGHVCGTSTAGLFGESARLWKLYVRAQAQGGGVGSQLLAVLEQELPHGVSALNLDYLEGNEQAARFYRAHGFLQVGRSEGLMGMANIEMSKSLVRE